MKYIEADGVDSILEIIPALPIQEQAECVNDITSKDLNLAKKVRRFYVGFHELNTLPAATLSQILKDFDHDVLATSLVQAPEQLVSYLLKLFPERMAQMIISTMETKYSVTSDEIDNARKKLVQHIIKELKCTGGRQV
jgi:flagellar motor switch protein FliG